MIVRHYHTEGDTEPLQYEMVDAETGALFDLTGATVTFSMWKQNYHTIVVDAQACTHNDSGGVITYPWVAADVDEPGDFFGQFTITLSSGKTRSEPRHYKNFMIILHPKVETEDTVA